MFYLLDTTCGKSLWMTSFGQFLLWHVQFRTRFKKIPTWKHFWYRLFIACYEGTLVCANHKLNVDHCATKREIWRLSFVNYIKLTEAYSSISLCEITLCIKYSINEAVTLVNKWNMKSGCSNFWWLSLNYKKNDISFAGFTMDIRYLICFQLEVFL